MVPCLFFTFFFILEVRHLLWKIREIKCLKCNIKIAQHSGKFLLFYYVYFSVYCLFTYNTEYIFFLMNLRGNEYF